MIWVAVGVYPASQGRQGVWDGGFRLGNITYATWDAGYAPSRRGSSASTRGVSSWRWLVPGPRLGL
jgi:hypothetical protein